MQDLERAFQRQVEDGQDTSEDDGELLLRRVSNLAFPVLLEWERASDIIRLGLERISWWERRMQSALPLTHERLKLSAARRANATEMLQLNNKNDVWRVLQIWLEQEEHEHQVPWELDQGSFASTHVQDEFGVDRFHFVVFRDTPAIRTISLNSKRPLYRVEGLDPVSLWTIPFQEATLVEMRNPKTDGRELFWINEQQLDPNAMMMMGFWNINRNNFVGGDDFILPPDMQGDDSLGDSVIVAGTESRLDVPNVCTSASCVTICSRDVMIFDQVLTSQSRTT